MYVYTYPPTHLPPLSTTHTHQPTHTPILLHCHIEHQEHCLWFDWEKQDFIEVVPGPAVIF